MTALSFTQLETMLGHASRADATCPFCSDTRATTNKRKAKIFRVWTSGDGMLSYNCVRCGARGYAHADSRANGHPPMVRRQETPREVHHYLSPKKIIKKVSGYDEQGRIIEMTERETYDLLPLAVAANVEGEK